MSPLPRTASKSDSPPIASTVILTRETLSFLRISFTKIEEALMRHVSVEDRIAGLDSGADDYMVKPFDLDELPYFVVKRLCADALRVVLLGG